MFSLSRSRAPEAPSTSATNHQGIRAMHHSSLLHPSTIAKTLCALSLGLMFGCSGSIEPLDQPTNNTTPSENNVDIEQPNNATPQDNNAANSTPAGPNCGNGVIDAGETCDGNCPTSCNDTGSCSVGTLTGSPNACTAVCMYEAVTACVNADGCCPFGCSSADDSDCSGMAPANNSTPDPNNSTPDPNNSTPDPNNSTPDPNNSSTGSNNTSPEYNGPPDCRDIAKWPTAWAQLEDEVLVIVNQERAQGATCGGQSFAPAPPLQMDDNLRIASRCHSLDMVDQAYFSHTGANGSSFSQRVSQTNYSGFPIGENIAAGQMSASQVMNGWMNSSGHCKNIMKSSAAKIGIGLATGNVQYGSRWTQVFGR